MENSARPYVEVAHRLAWLLKGIEEWLDGQPDSIQVKHSALKARFPDRVPSDQQLHSCLLALRAIGVLDGPEHTFRRPVFQATLGFRQGVLMALEVTQAYSSDSQAGIDLCLALPPSVEPPIRLRLAGKTLDLRGALNDIISSADKKLLVGIPFWDCNTTLEWTDLLQRRLEDGVSVDILLRQLGRMDGRASKRLRELKDSFPRCCLWEWAEDCQTDLFGIQTFHFKAVIADEGRKAYLGSANMTRASLQSQMELGVILRGNSAKELARIFREVLTIARPVGGTAAGST
jgi:hypothetical protein